MNPRDRIIKAKINLLINEPWFGQLACYLNLIERPASEIPSAAINERGDLFYNPEFIKKLNDLEVKGLVCHEILHLAYQHPFRMQFRHQILWNIAADLKVNADLVNRNDLKLPAGGLQVNGYSNEWSFGKVTIKDIDKKTTEQIYDELYSKVPPQVTQITITIPGPPIPGLKGKGKGGGMKIPLDKVPEPWKSMIEKLVKDLRKAAGKDKITPAQAKQLAGQWKERINAASQMMKGNVPAGFARELAALEHPELRWNQIIRQRFTKIAKIRTWRRPSKRWLPFYFPGTEKTKSLKAAIAIDTSGSMSQRDITRAVSEIWGLANSFSTFELFIIANDADVWDVIEVSNGNRSQIKKLRPRGGGGTNFRPVFKLIKKRWRNQIDCLVFFTDGYGDFPDKKPFYPVYWVTESDDVKWPFGKVIHLRPR